MVIGRYKKFLKEKISFTYFFYSIWYDHKLSFTQFRNYTTHYLVIRGSVTITKKYKKFIFIIYNKKWKKLLYRKNYFNIYFNNLLKMFKHHSFHFTIFLIIITIIGDKVYFMYKKFILSKIILLIFCDKNFFFKDSLKYLDAYAC